VIAGLVAALWILLVPLAFASPPDPSWIAGVYDGGDSDDVVTLIGLCASVTDLGGAPSVALDWHVRALVAADSPALCCPGIPSPQDRSPPVL
jgi:hypothetical protein